MKKMLFMLLILFLPMLSGCSSSGEGTPPQKPQGSTTSPASTLPSKTVGPLAMSYQDIFNGGSYLLHYKCTITFEGQTIKSDVTFATNGKDTSIVNVMDGMTAHILVKDGITYQIDDAAKTYYAIAETDGTENVLNITGKKRIGEGAGNVNGKGLPYEEYQVEDETTRFYFEGKKLYAVSTKTPDSESLMLVLELTDQVPTSALSIPAGYKIITVTAIPGGQVPDDLQKQVDDLIKEMENTSYPEGDYHGDPPSDE